MILRLRITFRNWLTSKTMRRRNWLRRREKRSWRRCRTRRMLVSSYNRLRVSVLKKRVALDVSSARKAILRNLLRYLECTSLIRKSSSVRSHQLEVVSLLLRAIAQWLTLTSYISCVIRMLTELILNLSNQRKNGKELSSEMTILSVTISSQLRVVIYLRTLMDRWLKDTSRFFRRLLDNQTQTD